MAGRGWTWARLTRVGAVALAVLVAVDVGLASRDDPGALARGTVRNAPGYMMADVSARIFAELDATTLKNAVGLVGSSITHGAGLPADLAPPAQLGRLLAPQGRAVLPLAQPGGTLTTAVAPCAAAAAHPFHTLLVELQPQHLTIAPIGLQNLATEEHHLLTDASPAQRTLLETAGLWPSTDQRLEAAAVDTLARHWRFYRLRGALWVDDQFTPAQILWTGRKAAAAHGLLPASLRGETTNVGRVPWRQAVAEGWSPGANQLVTFPTTQLHPAALERVDLVMALGKQAGVRVVFFEAPMNLAFLRHFRMLDAQNQATWETLRAAVARAMATRGHAYLPAPTLDDNAFLDRAHLTEAGATALAAHLLAGMDTVAPSTGGAAP